MSVETGICAATKLPLWRVTVSNVCVDVHAKTDEEARTIVFGRMRDGLITPTIDAYPVLCAGEEFGD